LAENETGVQRMERPRLVYFAAGWFPTLKVEAILSTETQVHVWTTWRYTPEDRSFQDLDIRYNPEGCGFESPWSGRFFLIYLTLAAPLGPGIYSASNGNEHYRHRNNIAGAKRRSAHETYKHTASSEPTMCDPYHLTILQASTASYGGNFTLLNVM
jgi:hypothetical protein